MKPTENSLLPYYKKLDLSKWEEWREYVFPGGEIVRIDNPQFLIVSDNGHRIGAGEISHYIPYGWIQLRWKNQPQRKEGFYCEAPDEMRVEETEKEN